MLAAHPPEAHASKRQLIPWASDWLSLRLRSVGQALRWLGLINRKATLPAEWLNPFGPTEINRPPSPQVPLHPWFFGLPIQIAPLDSSTVKSVVTSFINRIRRITNLFVPAVQF